MIKVYVCSFRDSEGTERTFDIEATSFEEAEEYLECITDNSKIDGVLIQRTDALPIHTQIGNC